MEGPESEGDSGASGELTGVDSEESSTLTDGDLGRMSIMPRESWWIDLETPSMKLP